MASRQAFLQQIKVMEVTVPVCVRLAMLVGPADGRPCPINPCPIKLLGALVTQLSRLAPDFASVAWPALSGLLADPYCVLLCVLRLLVSGWSLLHLLTQLV